MSHISFIIPSLNRPSLQRTIDSIDVWEGDEICLEFDKPRMNMWGNPQRNQAIARAKGDYLAFIDDDDWYVEEHRWIMDDAIQTHPGKLILFKMQYPNGSILWQTTEVIPGNVSTPMILIPNDKQLLHTWEGARNMADFLFIKGWKGEIAWYPKVIARLAHNDGDKNV